MSSYTEFSKDLPKRCGALLKKYFEVIKNDEKLEVTFLLSLASSGFIMPYERRAKKAITDHEKEKGNEYKTLKEKRFWEEPRLCKGFQKAEWTLVEKFGKIERFDNLEYQMINSKEKKNPTINKVLSGIRNSLAHASIFFDNGQHGSIKSIFFVGEIRRYDEKSKSFKVSTYILRTTPTSFKQFLVNWFDFLTEENVAEVFVLYNDLEEVG